MEEDILTIQQITNLIKKNFFNNVLQLIRGCRSRGIIISSGAQTSLQLRNLSDILIIIENFKFFTFSLIEK